MKTDRFFCFSARMTALPALALLAATAVAAPVTPEQAKAEVLAFRAGNAGFYKKAPADMLLSLAYTADGDFGNCFYIFNDEKGQGFTIVSADDRLPQVLGFSENGTFDYATAPENMKWWLSQYSEQISAFLEEDPQINPRFGKRAGAGDRTPIEPLLTSKWNQTAPYNDLCPIDTRTGRRSVTGCVATAMAQVMRYHQWPVNPQGTNAGYVFNGTTLDWANMIDDYESTRNYTAAQGTAVATLMRQCGAAVDMMYSSNASGAYDNDVPVGLQKYFDYDGGMRMQWRDYHTISGWNSLVYAELAEKRPVYYSGQSNQGGHAFVCDGYLGNNFFHFNWGWGGYQDGYFLLNSLNPNAGGTGSYSGGYNRNQVILTGVVPNRHSGDVKEQITLLSTGSFVWDKGNSFKIDGASQNLMYNPMAYEVSGNFGLKITSFDDPSKVTYAKVSSKSTFQSYYGAEGFSVNLPSLSSGKYRVEPAFYTKYEEWVDVQVPYGMQRFVTLTVEGGRNTLSNDGPEEEGKGILRAGQPMNVGNLYANAPKAYKVTVSNIGDGDYIGSVILSLWYEDDASGDGDEMEQRVAIPAGGSMDVEFYLPNTVKPGRYSVMVMDTDGNDIRETYIENYPNGNFTNLGNGDLRVESLSPLFPSTDGDLGVSIDIANESSDDITENLQIAVLRASDFSEAARISSSQDIVFTGDHITSIAFTPRALGLTPGQYYLAACGKDGKWLSAPVPMYAVSEDRTAEGVHYVVTDEAKKEAMIVSPMSSEYSGNVVIPATVNGYSVTAIKSDAFTFSSSLESVSVPASVRKIQTGQFYSARPMLNLTMRGQTPPVLEWEAFNPDRIGNVCVSSPDGYTNVYKRTEGWQDMAASGWTISYKDGAAYGSGLLNDPATGVPYTPYYVMRNESLRFFVSKPAGLSVEGSWSFGDTTGTGAFWEYVSLPAIYGNEGTVTFTAKHIDSVESILDENNGRADVYNVQGILLRRDADADFIGSLPKGLYIIGGRKVSL